MYVSCDKPACSQLNKISLGKQHKQSLESNNPFNLQPRGSATFDVNTKLVLGMLNAGIGETDVNHLLTTINLPEIFHKTIKSRENEIGSVLENFAKKSADSALFEEKKLTDQSIEGNSASGIDELINAAWQKRGSQRSYNSLSGFTSTIGKRSKKVVHFNSQVCRTCYKAAQQKKSPVKKSILKS